MLSVLFFHLLCRFDILQNKTEKFLKRYPLMQCIIKWNRMYSTIIFFNPMHTYASMCVRVTSAAVTVGPKERWLRQDRSSCVYDSSDWMNQIGRQAALLHWDFQRQADNGLVVFNTRLSKLLPCKLTCRARHWGRMHTSLPLPPAGETFLLSSHPVVGVQFKVGGHIQLQLITWEGILVES